MHPHNPLAKSDPHKVGDAPITKCVHGSLLPFCVSRKPQALLLGARFPTRDVSVLRIENLLACLLLVGITTTKVLAGEKIQV